MTKRTAILIVAGLVLGALVAQTPTKATTVTYDFTSGVPADWMTYNSQRIRASNVVAEDNATSLWTRPYGTEWRGASLVWDTPFTYGSVSVDLRVDAAHNTKALLMLWPVGAWPPEVDFLEMGGLDNWDRHKIALTAHYDPDNKMIHRSITTDMTQWSTVSVDWTPSTITFTDLRSGVTTTQAIANPGIGVAMKVQLVYWPTHKLDGDPWPWASSRMQVRSVTIAGA